MAVQVPFIEAARSIGASNWRTRAHVLPNVMAPIQMTVPFSTAILTEAARPSWARTRSRGAPRQPAPPRRARTC
jgi:hypothetical protein